MCHRGGRFWGFGARSPAGFNSLAAFILNFGVDIFLGHFILNSKDLYKHQNCAAFIGQAQNEIADAKKRSITMVFEFRKRIYGYECDVYGHLNNAIYLQLLEAARSEAMIEMDMSISRMRELGLQIFIRSFTLDYLKAVAHEDLITIKSWFDQINRVKGNWTQQIYNEQGELCFEARMVGVFACEGRAKRLPQDVFEHFGKYLEKV
jgi:YbgC/YbaW family acyl-CoA thioester hydrolase